MASISRLSFGLPGTIAGPVSPPFKAAARESSRNPPFGLGDGSAVALKASSRQNRPHLLLEEFNRRVVQGQERATAHSAEQDRKDNHGRGSLPAKNRRRHNASSLSGRSESIKQRHARALPAGGARAGAEIARARRRAGPWPVPGRNRHPVIHADRAGRLVQNPAAGEYHAIDVSLALVGHLGRENPFVAAPQNLPGVFKIEQGQAQPIQAAAGACAARRDTAAASLPASQAAAG